jgi:hypothetical protein
MGDIAALEKQLNIKTKQIAQLQVKTLQNNNSQSVVVMEVRPRPDMNVLKSQADPP